MVLCASISTVAATSSLGLGKSTLSLDEGPCGGLAVQLIFDSEFAFRTPCDNRPISDGLIAGEVELYIDSEGLASLHFVNYL